MTDSDVQTAEWTAVPGYYCEVTDGQPDGNGQARSIDRKTANGRQVKGTVLAQRLSNRGYPVVDVYDYQGARFTRTVHSLQMLAFEGPPPPGQQVRHYNDVSTDNRWAPGGEASCGPGKPGNLVHGTEKQNRLDGMRNNPAAPPRPVRLCGCGQPVTQGSKSRCHDCVVAVGVDGAELLRMGYTPGAAAVELEYPSADGLVRLAVKYGGHTELPPAQPGLSQRVRTTVRNWLRFGRGDSK
jgi:hypothetical protein